MPFPFFPVLVLAYLASICKFVMWCLSTFVCVWMWACVLVLILYLVWDRISWSLPFSLTVELLRIPHVPHPVCISISHPIIRAFGLQTFATMPGFLLLFVFFFAWFFMRILRYGDLTQFFIVMQWVLYSLSRIPELWCSCLMSCQVAK